MSKALLTDILRTIKRSMSRFISIIIIVALGTGFFVGVKSAAPSMEETAEQYFSDNNLMDLRVQSSIGLTEDDLNAALDDEAEHAAAEHAGKGDAPDDGQE